MSTLQIKLVAAERVVWSGEATFVVARTAEGELGALPGHTPVLSVIKPSVVEITTVDGQKVKAAVGFWNAEGVQIQAQEPTKVFKLDEHSDRLIAIQQMARAWNDDPGTLPILKARAQSDEHAQVRRSAVQELARGWKDDPAVQDFLETLK